MRFDTYKMFWIHTVHLKMILQWTGTIYYYSSLPFILHSAALWVSAICSSRDTADWQMRLIHNWNGYTAIQNKCYIWISRGKSEVKTKSFNLDFFLFYLTYAFPVKRFSDWMKFLIVSYQTHIMLFVEEEKRFSSLAFQLIKHAILMIESWSASKERINSIWFWLVNFKFTRRNENKR